MALSLGYIVERFHSPLVNELIGSNAIFVWNFARPCPTKLPPSPVHVFFHLRSSSHSNKIPCSAAYQSTTASQTSSITSIIQKPANEPSLLGEFALTADEQNVIVSSSADAYFASPT